MPPELVSQPGERRGVVGAPWVCVSLPPACPPALRRLPPPRGGAPNPGSPRPAAPSGFRPPAAALDTEWVAATGSRAGPPRPLQRRSRRRETGGSEEKVRGAAAPRRQAARLGHTFPPRRGLQRPHRVCAVGGTCLGPRAGPATRSGGQLARPLAACSPWLPALGPARPVGGRRPVEPRSPLSEPLQIPGSPGPLRHPGDF